MKLADGQRGRLEVPVEIPPVGGMVFPPIPAGHSFSVWNCDGKATTEEFSAIFDPLHGVSFPLIRMDKQYAWL